jgi:hypothetical protein
LLYGKNTIKGKNNYILLEYRFKNQEDCTFKFIHTNSDHTETEFTFISNKDKQNIQVIITKNSGTKWPELFLDSLTVTKMTDKTAVFNVTSLIDAFRLVTWLNDEDFLADFFTSNNSCFAEYVPGLSDKFIRFFKVLGKSNPPLPTIKSVSKYKCKSDNLLNKFKDMLNESHAEYLRSIIEKETINPIPNPNLIPIPIKKVDTSKLTTNINYLKSVCVTELDRVTREIGIIERLLGSSFERNMFNFMVSLVVKPEYSNNIGNKERILTILQDIQKQHELCDISIKEEKEDEIIIIRKKLRTLVTEYQTSVTFYSTTLPEIRYEGNVVYVVMKLIYDQINGEKVIEMINSHNSIDLHTHCDNIRFEINQIKSKLGNKVHSFVTSNKSLGQLTKTLASSNENSDNNNFNTLFSYLGRINELKEKMRVNLKAKFNYLDNTIEFRFNEFLATYGLPTRVSEYSTDNTVERLKRIIIKLENIERQLVILDQQTKL